MLNGNIERHVNIAAGAVELNGKIGGDATLDMGDAADGPLYFPGPPGAPPVINPGLRVSEDAEIDGDLTSHLTHFAKRMYFGVLPLPKSLS